MGYRTKRGLMRAVEGVSFTMERGRSLGLVGESGCGKTTVGMTLMGLLPRNGRVLGRTHSLSRRGPGPEDGGGDARGSGGTGSP